MYSISDKRFQEGTKEYEQYRDELNKIALWKKDIARIQAINAENRIPRKVLDVCWTTFEGIEVLRIENSRFVAVPTSERRSSRYFLILDTEGEREDFECQLKKSEVNRWLINAYENQ